jgi:hypothetical protein
MQHSIPLTIRLTGTLPSPLPFNSIAVERSIAAAKVIFIGWLFEVAINRCPPGLWDDCRLHCPSPFSMSYVCCDAQHRASRKLTARNPGRLNVAVERIDYQAGSVKGKGALIWNEKVSGRRPLLLVMTNWLGVTRTSLRRAAMSAFDPKRT